ncbi:MULTISPECIES: acyl-CoA thioesterase [Halolamina]|uniref:Acyl-CoA thioester hydrolase n=1 Tax=Halolamina pelagica TaxID=699431 RepID=A0A1I5MYK1_9EURY|nr:MULTISPECIES: thioesterase family protein [Halolamina]NHX36223.1 acyl-CoA thioesterase [Halolamina sp. R1-12]SFP14638.1 acyl-CoA thioester hydrolase [Halolamina pelagica]
MSYETSLDVRFRDIDAMGHVNNAVYATYAEQARADYFADVLDQDLSEVSSVLARIEIDYHRPIELGDGPVTVAVSVPRLGESSLPMEYEIRTAEGELAASVESVQVAYDREAGESVPLPDAWREAIAAYHEL